MADGESLVDERFHAMRRALNAAVLQLHVAKLHREGGNAEGLRSALDEVQTALDAVTGEVGALEREVRG